MKSEKLKSFLLKREMQMSVVPVSDARVDEYGNMVFVDRIFDEKEAAFYRASSDGLSFVN